MAPTTTPNNISRCECSAWQLELLHNANYSELRLNFDGPRATLLLHVCSHPKFPLAPLKIRSTSSSQFLKPKQHTRPLPPLLLNTSRSHSAHVKFSRLRCYTKCNWFRPRNCECTEKLLPPVRTIQLQTVSDTYNYPGFAVRQNGNHSLDKLAIIVIDWRRIIKK